MKLGPGWEVVEGALQKDYVFVDFVDAFSFMTACALAAEKAGHHPDWFNSYNKVIVRLMSHETGAVTKRDHDLARKFDELAGD